MLDGITWGEARRIREDAFQRTLGPSSGDGTLPRELPAHHPAAASKAILQRDFRDAGVVYDVSACDFYSNTTVTPFLSSLVLVT